MESRKAAVSGRSMRWPGRGTGADGRWRRREGSRRCCRQRAAIWIAEDLWGEGVGALGVGARAVTMRHSASRPRDGRNIANSKDRICPFSSHSSPHLPHLIPLRPRPLPPRGHKNKCRGNAQGRMTNGPMRKGPTPLSKLRFFAYWLARFLSLSSGSFWFFVLSFSLSGFSSKNSIV